MAFQLVSVRRRGFLGAAAFAVSILCAPALHAEAPKPDEILPLGETRERAIAAGETHGWRVTVEAGTAVAVVAEMRSIDLGLEARKTAGGEPIVVHGGHDRWGPEVLLLDVAGEYHIEIHPWEKSMWPGSYTLHSEALPASPTPSEGARQNALALMSRAGKEAVQDTAAAARKAVGTYRQALQDWQNLGEQEWEAETRVCLAVLEKTSLGDLPAATLDFQAALALWGKLKRPEREAEALTWLGLLYRDTQGLEAARDPWERAATLWLEAKNRFEEMTARTNLCYLEQRSGSLEVARGCYLKAAAFFSEAHVLRKEALVRSNLGGVYGLLGQPDQALESFQESLALRRVLGDDRNGEAETLVNIADIHRALGEWQEALRRYQEVRGIVEDLGNRGLKANVLSSIGFIYNSVGEPQRALGYFEGALELRRAMGDRLGEITILNNLGSARRSLGEPDRASGHFAKALKIAKEQRDMRAEALSRQHLAEVFLDRGDAESALREIQEALPSLLQGSRRLQAEGLHLEGRALNAAGKSEEARRVLRDALARRHDMRDGPGEAETLYELALAERSLGLVAESRAHAEELVERVETLRTGFLSADLRSSFLATRRQAFSLWIDLLMDQDAAEPGQGHALDAFAVSERSRAQGLLDVLRVGRPGRSAPPNLLKQRTAKLRELRGKIGQQWAQTGQRAATLRSEIDSLLAQLGDVEAEILRQNPRLANFGSRPLVAPEEIRRWLDPGTVLLEYSLGEKRSFLWAFEPGKDVRTFVLPRQQEIESLARRVYREMSEPPSGEAHHGEAAETLSRILLGPVWSGPGDPARLDRLIVVPDGALGLLPFAALPVPASGKAWGGSQAFRPLVEHLEAVSIPSATAFAVQKEVSDRRSVPSKWAAVLADPVFSAKAGLQAGPAGASRTAHASRVAKRSRLRDSGPAELSPQLDSLPATRHEAESIKSLAPAGQVWLGLGFAANRDAVLDGKLRDFRILHFATHAVADSLTPELSGLFLSQVDAQGHSRDGFLGLADIYELDLDADLVVLSGCRTALGKEVRGEGIMGLTRGFQYAGVPRVVASLWRIQDRATAELMTRFYQAMWREGRAPAAALREAQRALRSRYRDPYYWAAFVFQGDWH